MRRAYGILSLIVTAAAAGFAQYEEKSAVDAEPMETQSPPAVQTPEKAMNNWPEPARGIARVMIEKYGKPSQISDDALVWYNNGSWLKTVVYREARPQDKDYSSRPSPTRSPTTRSTLSSASTGGLLSTRPPGSSPHGPRARA